MSEKDDSALPGLIRQMYRMANSVHAIRTRNIRLSSDIQINSAALSVLNVIEAHEGENSIGLSRRMGVSKSAVSQMTAKLEKAGLLVKRRENGNRKEAYLYLTEQGRQCVLNYQTLHARFYQGIEGILDGLNEQQAGAVQDFFLQVNETLERFRKQFLTEDRRDEWE